MARHAARVAIAEIAIRGPKRPGNAACPVAEGKGRTGPTRVRGSEVAQVWRLAPIGDQRVEACASNRAETEVVMPPRAVNEPVTVIRLGAQTATRSSRILLVTAS